MSRMNRVRETDLVLYMTFDSACSVLQSSCRVVNRENQIKQISDILSKSETGITMMANRQWLSNSSLLLIWDSGSLWQVKQHESDQIFNAANWNSVIRSFRTPLPRATTWWQCFLWSFRLDKDDSGCDFVWLCERSKGGWSKQRRVIYATWRIKVRHTALMSSKCSGKFERWDVVCWWYINSLANHNQWKQALCMTV